MFQRARAFGSICSPFFEKKIQFDRLGLPLLVPPPSSSPVHFPPYVVMVCGYAQFTILYCYGDKNLSSIFCMDLFRSFSGQRQPFCHIKKSQPFCHILFKETPSETIKNHVFPRRARQVLPHPSPRRPLPRRRRSRFGPRPRALGPPFNANPQGHHQERVGFVYQFIHRFFGACELAV